MKLRDIPSVHTLLNKLQWEKVYLPREYVKLIIRQELANIRRMVKNGEIPLEESEINENIYSLVLKLNRPSLTKVINGTGIILHTGLGRAPLSRKVLRNAMSEMEGYSNLEIDLNDGKRGERIDHVSLLLNALTGAESSLVVNNNAAAVLLSLNTLAEGKEVLISRGQLIEIGGLFRIPDVIGKSGAKLVEVGTTNRTHFEDYVRAISDKTGIILVVHTSNYRIQGFTKEVSLPELASVCQKKKVSLVVDLGSGALFNLEDADLPYEPVVSDVLKQGANLVTFSGDKLLGGPQAGVICGKKRLVSKLHRNPLYRAVRCDKMTISLLEQTVRSFRQKPPDRGNLTYLLFTTSRNKLMNRGQRLVKSVSKMAVKKLGLNVVTSEVEAGSGSLPTEKIESAALQFHTRIIKPSELSERFRNQKIPILGYVSGNQFRIDLKAVLPGQDKDLTQAIEKIAKTIR